MRQRDRLVRTRSGTSTALVRTRLDMRIPRREQLTRYCRTVDYCRVTHLEDRYYLTYTAVSGYDPEVVLACSGEPFMEPCAGYEVQGFFGNVVFSNGHMLVGDRLLIHYGASDTTVCRGTVEPERIEEKPRPA